RAARMGEDRFANARPRRPLSADRRLRHAGRSALGRLAQQAGIDRLDVSAAIRQSLDLRPAAGLGPGRIPRALPASWRAGVSTVPARFERDPDGLEQRPCADARRRLDAGREQEQTSQTTRVATLDPPDAAARRLDRVATHLQAPIRLRTPGASADADPGRDAHSCGY